MFPNVVDVFDLYTRDYFNKSDPLDYGRTAIVRMSINGLPLRLEGSGANNDLAFLALIKTVATVIDNEFLKIASLAAPVAIAHPNIVEQTGEVRHDTTSIERKFHNSHEKIIEWLICHFRAMEGTDYLDGDIFSGLDSTEQNELKRLRDIARKKGGKT